MLMKYALYGEIPKVAPNEYFGTGLFQKEADALAAAQKYTEQLYDKFAESGDVLDSLFCEKKAIKKVDRLIYLEQLPLEERTKAIEKETDKIYKDLRRATISFYVEPVSTEYDEF